MNPKIIRPACGGHPFGFRKLVPALLLGLVTFVCLLPCEAPADEVQEHDLTGEDELNIGVPDASSGDRGPSRHDRVPDAMRIPPGTAEHIYRDLMAKLAAAYEKSGEPIAAIYQKWLRANTAPYHSYSHGRRLLNNYVNETGKAYIEFENAGELPAGSIVAKDSFAVDANGKVLSGPLFLMEKMPKGFNYVSGDWRFTQINADGTLVGQTKGANAAAVDHCVHCHLAAEKTDYLFFIPEEYRNTRGQ